MYILIIGAIIGVICAAVAHSKGRSAVGWFFIGFFFGLIALILVLVVSNLKEAKEKEEYMKMEQKRLHEQLRQEQMKTERLRKYTQARLDVHDKELNVDTRHIGHLLEQGSERPMLDHERGLVDLVIPMQSVGTEPDKEKIKTQCPHCQASFKTGYMHKGKEVVCPKCTKRFVITRIVESAIVEQCAQCGRIIDETEKAYVSEDRILCMQCEQKLGEGSEGARSRKDGAYYQQGWYYRKQHESVGPLSLAMLRQLVQERKIDAHTHVWHESLQDWTAAGRVSHLDMEPGNG